MSGVPGGFAAYGVVLADRPARAFSLAGLVARLPMSMVGLGIAWATGAQYMIVNEHIDERYSPIKATVTAGRLLQSYNRALESSPLTITSYNHGIGNIHKAVRGAGSRELHEIIARYHRGSAPKKKHRNFGMLDKTLRQRIKRLSAILRVADGFDRGHVSAQPPRQQLPPAGQPTGHRPERPAELPGGLLEGHAVQVAQDDGHAVLLRQEAQLLGQRQPALRRRRRPRP